MGLFVVEFNLLQFELGDTIWLKREVMYEDMQWKS